MNKTHRTKEPDGYDVTAWQYLKTSPRPIWVFKRFHDCGNGCLEAVALDGHLQVVNETDWIVVLDDEIAVVITDAEMQQVFEPLPAKEANDRS